MTVLGIDLGTGSTKAAVLAPSGRVLGRGSCPHPVRSSHTGAAETDPEDWLTSVSRAVTEALDRAERPTVDAIGVSGQMHGVVCVDAHGTPLRPALLWADVRASAQCAAYRRLNEADLRTLANPVVPGMFGPLLAWALEREPDLRSGMQWALSPKDWLRLILTGSACTEPSDASATLVWDIPASRWSDVVIDALGLPASALPPVIASDHAAGRLSAHGAQVLGIEPGVVVATGAADVAAAILGSGLASGELQLSIGTGAQLVTPVDDLHLAQVPVTHRYRRAEASGWYAMAAIQNAGLALEWVRDVLEASWDELHQALDDVPPGADGVTFHAYLTGERTPVLDTTVRGAWQGLGLHTRRPALLRAAMEGVAFAIRDGLVALQADGIDADVIRLVGGGSSAARWSTLLATTLNRRLTIHQLADASVIGAARLGATAVGLMVPPLSDDQPAVINPDSQGIGAMDDAWRRWRTRPPAGAM